MRPTGKLSWLGWLWNAPQPPAPTNVGRLLDRLVHVRSLAVDRARMATIPEPVFARLADEATRIAIQHLAGMAPLRRHASLVAGVIALETDLIDAALAMFEKLMAQYERAARSMREIQGDLGLFAASGRVLVDAHALGRDLDAALWTAVGWRHFEAAVVRAEVASGPDRIDPTAELVTRHKSVRLFGPALLQHLAFEGSVAVKDLLAALDVIRATNRIFADYDDIVGPCCEAWNKLIDLPTTITSIGTREWAQRS